MAGMQYARVKNMVLTLVCAGSAVKLTDAVQHHGVIQELRLNKQKNRQRAIGGIFGICTQCTETR